MRFSYLLSSCSPDTPLISLLDVLSTCRHDHRPSIRILHGRYPGVHHSRQVRRLCRALARHHDHPRCQCPLDARCRDRHGRQASVWFLLSCRPLNSNQAMYQHSYYTDMRGWEFRCTICTYYLTAMYRYRYITLLYLPCCHCTLSHLCLCTT